MSTRTRAQSPARAAESVQAGGSQVVQDLLVQVRALRVENERLRLETRESRERAGRPDPRLRNLEAENRRLREELEAARQERDALRSGVGAALDALRKGSAARR